jgi:hypothetical protein
MKLNNVFSLAAWRQKAKSMTDNYFRVGRNIYLFSSKDLLQAHRAWNEARAASEASAVGADGKRLPPTKVAVYRPFKLHGPWWDCDVIGFMAAGDMPDLAGGIDEEESNANTTWLERVQLRKALWATGANHVDGQGFPVTGA